MATLLRDTAKYINGDISKEEFRDSTDAPENETEMIVLGAGVIGTSAIGTVWLLVQLFRLGRRVRNFLKR